MQSLLSSHLSRLEIDVGALDSKVDSLGHEIHQIEANLTPVEECTRVIEESMKKAIDILRDPKRPSDAPQATSTRLHDTASAMGASTGSSTAVATDAHFGGVSSSHIRLAKQAAAHSYASWVVKPDPNHPPNFLWLLKWCEFGIEECTWKPTHTFDGTTLIKEFYAAAQAEELDLTYEVSADKVILLNEAREFVGTWVTSHA
ncbi:SubName: Full=Uncharacterized protein {ECO:0000313/EMBL:CCA68675.1} [Serendipita indica DSM 11827]|nr:SubName: Full=Uncharacterized protein {ECO:0000313/EMBL:CCA68675.1} [Serendipita indica DSM 11827]